MKKMFCMLALIVSSFFLYLSEARADDPYIVNYPNDFLDLINEDFLSVRDYAISNLDTTYPYYLIYLQSSEYEVYYFTFSNFISSGRSWFQMISVNPKVCFYSFETNSFRSCAETPSIVKFSSNIYYVLDSNMDIYYNPYSLQINYLEKSYIVDSTNKFLTTYDIYKEENGIGEETDSSHDDELNIIQSFYDIAIDKLSYLALAISTNYIFLSIFVIFILIFVFELIFRRYL